MAGTELTRLVAPHLREQRRGLLGSVGLTALTVGVELARPWPLTLAVDHLLTPGPASRDSNGSGVQWLALAAVVTALLTALSAGLDSLAEFSAESAAERVGADVRERAFGHAVRLDLDWHDRVRSGELVSRLTTDVSRVLDGLVAATTVLVPETLALLGIAIVLLVVDPILALVALAACPVLWLLAVRQRSLVRTAQQQARSASGDLVARSADLLRNVAAIHAFGRHDRATQAFGVQSQAVLRRERAALAVRARWAPRSEMVLAIGSALVLLVGGWQVLQGRQSVGVLLVVLAYTRGLYAPVRSLAQLSGSLAKADASAERIGEVLSTTSTLTSAVPSRPLGPVAHSVRFEDVSVSYGDRRALQHLTFEVAAGETVCLVGTSGSGKSTALSLLLRLRDPDRGSVRIDGHDLRELDLDDLRRHVAYLPQQAWLLDASLADNIGLGAEQPSRTAVVRAGMAAGLHDVVRRLPHGWDTQLGEDGRRLSGGQQRRVALARAVVSGAPVMVLDEPTASLDARTAADVVATIRDLTWHRTAVIATHDPALMAIADRVVDLTGPPSGHPTGPPTGHPMSPLMFPDTGEEVFCHDDPPRHHRRDPAPRSQPEPQPLA